VAVLLVAASLSACWRYGFAGGGLPPNIKTVAILPFDNETATAELQQQLYDAMHKTLEGRLGLRDESETRADAIVKGTILRYDTDVPIGYSGTGTGVQSVSPTRRKLELSVNVEIDDQITGKTLWKRDGLVADGQYAEGAEDDGRKQALQKIVELMVEGAQSQW
jgi:hypothetical protein